MSRLRPAETRKELGPAVKQLGVLQFPDWDKSFTHSLRFGRALVKHLHVQRRASSGESTSVLFSMETSGNDRERKGSGLFRLVFPGEDLTVTSRS
jgi:hypothetical protein